MLPSHVKSASCMRELAASFPRFFCSFVSFRLFILSSSPFLVYLSSFYVSFLSRCFAWASSPFLHIRLFTFSLMYCNWMYMCYMSRTHMQLRIVSRNSKECLGTYFPFYNHIFIGPYIVYALLLYPYTHLYAYTLHYPEHVYDIHIVHTIVASKVTPPFTSMVASFSHRVMCFFFFIYMCRYKHIHPRHSVHVYDIYYTHKRTPL